MCSTGDDHIVPALEEQHQLIENGSGGNKKIPAAAPLPVGYVETVELEAMLMHQCKLAVEHEANGASLFKKNGLKKALQELELSLLNLNQTLEHCRNLERYYRFNAELLQRHHHPGKEKVQQKQQEIQNSLRLTLLSVSSTHSKLGCVLYKQDDLHGALQNYQNAAFLSQALDGPGSHSLQYLSSAIQSIHNQIQHREQRRLQKQLAEQPQRQQQKRFTRQQQEQLDIEQLRVAIFRFQKGYALHQQGEVILAMEEYKQAAEICQQQLNHYGEAVCLLNMIDSLCCGNNKKKVIEKYQGALRVPEWTKVSASAEEKQPSQHAKGETTTQLPVKLPLPNPSQDKNDIPRASLEPTYETRWTSNDVFSHANSPPLETQCEACLDQKLPSLATELTSKRRRQQPTTKPLKKRRVTLDVSKLNCSPGLLEAIKWEQARAALQEEKGEVRQ